ncbi:hypothetical protein BpHYR1_005385 [Brachionus plicatilis]|uniref:Uncharacterized protein n=1 Tax=Brachionus plicatilis TaxID=10195 RepID=A0A3M7RGR9_BRAPC|nr:hypothetical protein BpHYR1_005385 [Brachionus plicatilis]
MTSEQNNVINYNLMVKVIQKTVSNASLPLDIQKITSYIEFDFYSLKSNGKIGVTDSLNEIND